MPLQAHEPRHRVGRLRPWGGFFLEANDALRRRRHGRCARTCGAGRCRGLDGRSALVGRAVLPADGQRRVRRPALRPRAGLRPGHAGARRQGEGHADPDAGPGPVQPGPARLVRRLARGHRQPAGRVLPGGRAGARDHAAAEAARRPHLHGRGRLSRRARDRRRPRRQLRGLGQEPRRRVRRQRAAGLAGLVPRQRRPERQGDSTTSRSRCRRATSRSATACCSRPSPTAAGRRGAGARTRRWRAT